MSMHCLDMTQQLITAVEALLTTELTPSFLTIEQRGNWVMFFEVTSHIRGAGERFGAARVTALEARLICCWIGKRKVAECVMSRGDALAPRGVLHNGISWSCNASIEDASDRVVAVASGMLGMGVGWSCNAIIKDAGDRVVAVTSGILSMAVGWSYDILTEEPVNRKIITV